jgi:3-oxoacyl-(acyl-carrier-protein) synthase
VEAAVLHSIFGDQPYLSGTKAVTGHSIGAVGAMETIISVKVLQEQLIPATTNLTKSDCAGKHVIGKAISEPVQHVLTNSFGFGGTNSALIISRC